MSTEYSDQIKELSELEFEITQNGATEAPFKNKYWNNQEEGIYVDRITGKPLFSSLNKIDYACGWPTFDAPLIQENITEALDHSTPTRVKTEVRGDAGHLGHVFDDGPTETGLRYCINSASLRFIAKDKLIDEGYAEYLAIFNKS